MLFGSKLQERDGQCKQVPVFFFCKRIDDELIYLSKYYSMKIAKQSKVTQQRKERGLSRGQAALRAELIYCRRGPSFLFVFNEV